jgi:hypothetical protein
MQPRDQTHRGTEPQIGFKFPFGERRIGEFAPDQAIFAMLLDRLPRLVT